MGDKKKKRNNHASCCLVCGHENESEAINFPQKTNIIILTAIMHKIYVRSRPVESVSHLRIEIERNKRNQRKQQANKKRRKT